MNLIFVLMSDSFRLLFKIINESEATYDVSEGVLVGGVILLVGGVIDRMLSTFSDIVSRSKSLFVYCLRTCLFFYIKVIIRCGSILDSDWSEGVDLIVCNSISDRWACYNTNRRVIVMP